MASVYILPSSYTLSNTQYLSISNPSNMYTRVDQGAYENYATLTHNRASTSTYYLYLTGFDFSSVTIPSNATVTGFSVRIKASGSGLNTNSSYRMSLYNGTSAISNTTVTSSITATTTTFTFPNGNLTWDSLKQLTDFRIRVPIRRLSSNVSASINIYGAEVNVMYTLPGHTITLSTEANDISAIGYDGSTWQNSTTVDDGGYFQILISGNLNNIVVTDNNVDVTSSLVYHDDDGEKIYDQYNYNKYDVHEDHDIVVSHSSSQTTYTVTATTSDSSFSIETTPLNGIVGTGRGCMVYIESSDFTNLHVTDNNIDVTSSLIYVPEEVTSGDTYPAYYYFNILNVQTNHTVVVSRLNSSSYNVSFLNSSSGVTTEPSITTSVPSGESQEIIFNGISNLNNVEITDNNVDITSNLVYNAAGTKTISLIPATVDEYSGTLDSYYTLYNGLADSTSDTQARLYFDEATSIYVIYGFNVPKIPSNATNISVSCVLKGHYNGWYVNVRKAQLYCGNTAKGSSINLQSSNVSAQTMSNTGTWTASELSNLKLRLDGNTTQTAASNFIGLYGADITITYTISSGYYTYTISNIAANHTIEISDLNRLYLKSNGSWLQTTKVYKKSNNAWVEQSDYSSLFSNNDIWIKV